MRPMRRSGSLAGEKLKRCSLTPTAPGKLLSELLQASDIIFNLPCAGNHTCGKCKLLVEGALSPVSASERTLLTEEELTSGMRMACFARVLGPVTVTLPERGEENILADGTKILHVGESLMASDQYGAAIDIGTTTVVCALYAPGNPEPLAVERSLNHQQVFGADIISRIDYGIKNGNNDIHQAIVRQLESMLHSLAAQAQINRNDITHAVVTGNTTMLHFFSGLDPGGIGFLPFLPQSLFGTWHTGILRGIDAYLPPCVSAYVGADLVCCAMAAEMCERGGPALIMDIGTNGEMALLHDGTLYCCSTAAGPAFEGAGISRGMLAAPGAIAHVSPDISHGIKIDTIAGASPAGLCGSGIIDTAAMLLACGAMSEMGRMELAGHPLAEFVEDMPDNRLFHFPGTDITFSQDDIRKLQVAKAAIAAGIETLLSACGSRINDLDVVYICGGFGSFLDLKSAESICLIPPGSAECAVVLGNGALTGAATVLLDRSCIEKLQQIRSCSHYIELSDSPEFMDSYVDHMCFPPLAAKQF